MLVTTRMGLERLMWLPSLVGGLGDAADEFVVADCFDRDWEDELA